MASPVFTGAPSASSTWLFLLLALPLLLPASGPARRRQPADELLKLRMCHTGPKRARGRSGNPRSISQIPRSRFGLVCTGAEAEKNGGSSAIFAPKVQKVQLQEDERGSAWSRIAPLFEPPAQFAGQLGPYRDWLLDDQGQTLADAAAWRKRRAELREQWRTMLGHWPPLIRSSRLRYEEFTQRQDGVRQYRLVVDLAPGHAHHAYLLLPSGAKPTRGLPAVVTVFYEPETGIGQGKENLDFALQLARRGFVTLSIGHDYSLYFPDREHASLQPLAALAYAAANAYYAVAQRPEVDPQRVGILGHSYGGKWAMFAAALFDEFACGAWSDPGIVFDDQRPSVNYWEPWYLGYAGPDFRPRGLPTPENPATGLYAQLRAEGRDLHELHLMLAPRPFFVSGGAEDPPARWLALNHSIQLNRMLGFSHRVGMSNRSDHAPTAESNQQIYDFFSHFLGQEEVGNCAN